MNTTLLDGSYQEDGSLSRVEYAYTKIKQNIFNNIYPAGHQVLEPDLAKQLGVSRTPVREALIRLESDNLIQLIPRKGMRVCPLSGKDIEEIHQLITLLEIGAIHSVCSSAIPSVVSQLSMNLSTLRDAAIADDKHSWLESENAFYTTFVALSGNQRMLITVKNLYDQLHRVRLVNLVHVGDISQFATMSETFFAALKNRGLDEAISVHRKYREKLLLSLMAK